MGREMLRQKKENPIPKKAKEDLNKFIAEFRGEDKWRNIAKELLANLAK